MSIMKKEFTIKSSLAEVRPLVKEVISSLRELAPGSDLLHDFKLAAEEALINAVKHGNNFKEELPVLVTVEGDTDKVTISVEDKGRGYDYSKVPDPTLDENIARGGGRGLYLIKKLMDEVRFNKEGNRIEMVKYLK